MKVVILCGGRTFAKYTLIYTALDVERAKIRFLIQGGASGADQHGKNAAVLLRLPHLQIDAEWKRFGRSAGAVRNERMLEEARKLAAGTDDTVEVWAFRRDLWVPDPATGGNGTLDMCARAVSNGFPARWYSRTHEWRPLVWIDNRVVVVGEETFTHDAASQSAAAARLLVG